jgi:hypothetical protein
MIKGNRVDYWKQSYQKRAYVRGAAQNAVAGEYSHIELWNPAASGVNLIVTQAVASCGSWNLMSLCWHNAAFAAGAAARNKYFDEAISNAFVRWDTDANLIGIIIASVKHGETITPFIKQDHPIVVIEDRGLIIRCDIVNSIVSGLFHWMEVPS